MNAAARTIISLLIVFLIPVVSYAELNFERGGIVGVGKRASTIDAGDIDGDGDLDLAIANIFSDSITIAYNDGNGNFTPTALPLDGGLKHPVALAIGDLNNDGREDIVAVNIQHIEESETAFRGANVIFCYSDPDDTFFQSPLGILGVPSSVEINDMDGDGDNDVLVGNNGEFSFNASGVVQTDAGIFPYENRGQSRFIASIPINTFGSLVDLISFDYDSDGKMDVIGIDQGILNIDPSTYELGYTDQMLDIFKGTDEGLSEPQETTLNLTPWSLDSGDFDADGITDVAVTIVGDMDVTSFLGTNASVNIYRNTGTRLNALAVVPMPGVAYSVLAGDYDADGDADMAVTVQELTDIGGAISLDASLKFYENDGTGLMTETASYFVEEEPRYTTKGDFDGDGDIDLAILCTILDAAEENNAIEGRVYLFFNNHTTKIPTWEIY